MTRWLTDGQWVYDTYSPDEPSETFEGLAPLVSRWQIKRNSHPNRKIPSWSDFDLHDLEGFWGWATVYDLIDLETPSVFVRLWGTNVARICGYDITGQTITAEGRPHAVDYTTITANDVRFLAHLASHQRIGFSGGPYVAELEDWNQYRELHLPLSNDGETITNILMVGWLSAHGTV